MDIRPRSWLVSLAVLLACAPGPRGSDGKLDELGRAAKRCNASIAPVVSAARFPISIDPAIESTCEPVWKLRAELADGFEPPAEYRLLLAHYLNLSALYEVEESRDPARVERTLLRAVRIAEDVRTSPAQRAYTYARLAGLYLEDRPDEHGRVFRRALDLAEESGDLDLLSGLHLELAEVRRTQGNLAEAEALASKGMAFVEERIQRIDGGERIENSRVRGPEPQASELRRGIARSSTERQRARAQELLATIERCQRYASAFEPEQAAQCCREGELRRALDPRACQLPGDARP